MKRRDSSRIMRTCLLETVLPHLSNAKIALVGIGTVLVKVCCRDINGPSPSISLDKKMTNYSIF